MMGSPVNNDDSHLEREVLLALLTFAVKLSPRLINSYRALIDVSDMVGSSQLESEHNHRTAIKQKLIREVLSKIDQQDTNETEYKKHDSKWKEALKGIDSQKIRHEFFNSINDK